MPSSTFVTINTKALTMSLLSRLKHGLKSSSICLPYLPQLLRGNVFLLLRRKHPRLLFMEPHALIQGYSYITISSYARLKRFCRITAYSGGAITIGSRFTLGDYSVVENSYRKGAMAGSIFIGSNVAIGAFSYVSCPSNISIGDDCIIGQYFSAHAQNHNYNGKGLIRLQGTSESGIKIESNCWIGSKVTILDGVSIGNSSVIAAGSVVNRSFPPRSVLAGCPARIIKSL